MLDVHAKADGFILKVMDFVLKVMDFVLKVMDFAEPAPRCAADAGVGARYAGECARVLPGG